jgi:predicted ArsR family transcriptional regulator
VNPDVFDEQVAGVAALGHPLTARVYRLVGERGWLSRDAAAEALEVVRSVAAFHLDKLVDAGLLETRFERITGRTGPGAGRPAKLYRHSGATIDLTIPARRYELAGSLLADAVARSMLEGGSAGDALSRVAREAGEAIGAQTPPHPNGPAAGLTEVLVRHGFEPRERDGDIALLNCPFHALAERHRAMVCGMNLEFLGGVLSGLGADGLIARLAPEPGQCCVRIEPRPA